MASLKAEKPVGGGVSHQSSASGQGQPKKEPGKPSSSAPKAPTSKPLPKRADHKPREPKKKASGAKSSAAK